MSIQPNHDIMNENVIDREELIQYLTWILPPKRVDTHLGPSTT